MRMASLPYRLAAIDLDGTLLNEEKQISAANLAAVRKLESAGIKIALASGRTHESIMNFQKELQLTGPIISNHGSLAKHSQTNEIISFNSLKVEAAKRVVAEAIKHETTIIYCRLDAAYIVENNKWTDLFQSRAGRQANFIDSFDSLPNEGTCKIIWMNEPPVLSTLHATLPAEFANEYYVARGDAEHLEFLSNTVN